jgi:hypothetical protein
MLKKDWSVSAIAAGFLAVLISYSGPAAHHPSVSGESLLTSGSGVWFKASAHF